MTAAYIGKYYGWRRFKVYDGTLHPTIIAQHTTFANNEQARCNPSHNIYNEYSFKERHPVPQTNCHCGYYAYTTLQHLMRDDVHGILALISATGRIIEHEVGFRSEYMKIEKLFPRPFQYTPRTLHKLRKTYECKIVHGKWPQDLKPTKYPNIITNNNMVTCTQIPERELIYKK